MTRLSPGLRYIYSIGEERMTRLSPGLRYIVHDVMIFNEFLLFILLQKRVRRDFLRSPRV